MALAPPLGRPAAAAGAGVARARHRAGGALERRPHARTLRARREQRNAAAGGRTARSRCSRSRRCAARSIVAHELSRGGHAARDRGLARVGQRAGDGLERAGAARPIGRVRSPRARRRQQRLPRVRPPRQRRHRRRRRAVARPRRARRGGRRGDGDPLHRAAGRQREGARRQCAVDPGGPCGDRIGAPHRPRRGDRRLPPDPGRRSRPAQRRRDLPGDLRRRRDDRQPSASPRPAAWSSWRSTWRRSSKASPGSSRTTCSVCIVDNGAPAERRRLAGPPGCEAEPAAMLHVRPLSFAGRQWDLRVFARPAQIPERLQRQRLAVRAGRAGVGGDARRLPADDHRPHAAHRDRGARAHRRAARPRSANARWREAALRDSEQRFRNILDHVPIGVIYTDLQRPRDPDQPALLRADRLPRRRAADAARCSTCTHPDDVAQDVELVGRLVRGEIPMYRRHKRYITQRRRASSGCSRRSRCCATRRTSRGASSASSRTSPSTCGSRRPSARARPPRRRTGRRANSSRA